MSDACRVGRMAVRAGTRAAGDRTVRQIETALRLAAWPRASPGEVVLLRRLDLGPVPEDASVHALTDLIGRRLANIRPVRLQPGDPERPEAPAVAFAGRLEALAALAVQLARHGTAGAWYWSRLLPTPVGRMSLADLTPRLLAAAEAPPRRIAGVAGLADILAESGAIGPFVAALPPEAAARFAAAGRGAGAPLPTERAVEPTSAGSPVRQALTAAPGVTSRSAEASATWRALPAVWRAAIEQQGRVLPRADPRLEWLVTMATVATFGPAALERSGAIVAELASLGRQADPAAQPVMRPPSTARTPATAGTAERSRPTLPRSEARSPPAPPGMLSHEAAETRREPDAAVVPVSAWAGLWLLPAALARLRVTEIASGHGMGLGLAVMHAVAARLGVPEGDPALAPLPLPLAEPPPAPFAVPASWRRLAAPHARASPAMALCRSGGLRLLTDRAGRLPLAWTGDRQNLRRITAGHAVHRRPDQDAPPPGLALRALYLALVRDLRRSARISLRRLVHRQGLVVASATHVDVTFPGEVIELPLRRAGLDLDPGWVPWLGRVVTYHYDLEGRLFP